MTKLPGKLVISRITSSAGDAIHIDFIDGVSGAYISASMSLETFALAVTGLGYLDVEFDARGMDRFGWRKVRGTERMYVGKARPTYEDIQKTFDEFWDDSGLTLDMSNMSRIPATTQDGEDVWHLDVPVYWFEKE